MADTPNIRNLESSNQKYASSFTEGSLALPPAKKYAVVTCMDARIDPVNAFGIPLGDAHIIRNAGGSAVEGLRSLVISEQLLGTTEIFVIKHTGCGMLTFKDADARAVVAKNLGEDAAKETDAHFKTWLPFPDLAEAVKDDINFLKSKKVIPDSVNISGWIYEVETGKTKRVA